ncbi:MAG: dethiobiotin synthase [Steroidobacteraceae bacterium]
MRGCFVTGTDTGVGKTLCSQGLILALASRGLKVAAMKPVASGADFDPQRPTRLVSEDATALRSVSNVDLPYGDLNPYCFKEPISPHIAADLAGIDIEIETILRHLRALAARSEAVVVEGAGGFLVPLNDRQDMAELARAVALPVVLVVGLRLGCLNHAFLTAEAIRSRGLPFAGWIANAIDPQFEQAEANLATLQQQLGAPLARLPYGVRAAAAGAQLATSLGRWFEKT